LRKLITFEVKVSNLIKIVNRPRVGCVKLRIVDIEFFLEDLLKMWGKSIPEIPNILLEITARDAARVKEYV